MKTASQLLSHLSLSRVLHLTLACTFALALDVTTGCGSGSTTPALKGNTSVTVLLAGSANDQLSQFTVTLSKIALTSQSGKTVSLFAAPQTPEFIHLNGTVEPLVTVSVPQDVYTSATVTIQYATFTCVSILPSGGGIQTSEFGLNSAPSATVTLPSPITVSGTAMALSLDLQASQSATFSSCNLVGAAYSLTPTFALSAVVLASQPTNVGNGKETGIDGVISSVSATGFSLVTADGITLSVNAGGSTVYQGGVNAFSAIVTGMPVDLDAAIQPDGSLLATRVAVEDEEVTSLSVLNGPVLNVAASEPVLAMAGREEQGYLFPGLIGGAQYVSFGSAVFQTSGQFSNTQIQSLPFTASFTAVNMFAGQNVYASSHALVFSGGPTYLPATTITLMPQTINGTVTAVSTSGGFTTYTVTLANYDLIPSLAVQPGQTTLLSDPSSVVVYVDSNTQMLNTMPLTVGSVLRFNGLLFNDNGLLRMDCGQVNDGVAE